ncbi:MAG: fibronectin type III domain-containing protein [Cytophagaceae bacterium]|nr:fibronectin type III domain-containing protein [Cytophagaceae bacterium]
MVYRLTAFILLAILFCFFSCEKENQTEDSTFLIIQDTAMSTDTSIVIDGVIIGQRINIDTLGIYYQQSGTPYSNRVTFGSRTSPGKFQMEVRGLNPFTNYYYHIYAVNKNGVYHTSPMYTIMTSGGK